MNNKGRLINKILDVPNEIANSELKITVWGFKKMMIENYSAVLEYQDFYIRLKTPIGIVNINGFNMDLEEMNSDDIIVLGDIDSIDFEKIED